MKLIKELIEENVTDFNADEVSVSHVDDSDDVTVKFHGLDEAGEDHIWSMKIHCGSDYQFGEIGKLLNRMGFAYACDACTLKPIKDYLHTNPSDPENLDRYSMQFTRTEYYERQSKKKQEKKRD